ncbi:MAG TPA: altronate dehydratase family protein [Clostridiales bacterium]|nr:altronate dehydratase family protein [Clostridiales bacterium]
MEQKNESGQKDFIILDKKDNVAVALKDMDIGDIISVAGDAAMDISDTIEDINDTTVCDGKAERIKAGHKVAIRDIPKGENIIKYGYPIGHATCHISAGQWVHTHNARTNLHGILEYTYKCNTDCNIDCKTLVNSGDTGDKAFSSPDDNKANPFTFKGYLREDGNVGTRNEIWIINTVGCVNKTAEILAREANRIFSNKIGQNFDGIFAFPHPYGCSQLGEDHFTTQKLLSALAKHPNAAGILVLGLGCENNNIDEFKKILDEKNKDRIRFLSTQDCEDEVSSGIKLIAELIDYTAPFQRQNCPISKLTIGFKCGGSDAFSGITANPLCGEFSDIILEQGGTTILTEVPEMFGAETILMDRCVNKDVFNKTVEMINGFKEYFIRHNQTIYENPSPGNKEGGISTLEEKSLGCILKGGSGAVADVLKYADKVKKTGLNLLEGPGNDAVSITALTAAGANLIIFTTGRGTPLGAPVPTIKVSTTTDLYNRKGAWIDYNAGQLLECKSIKSVANDFFSFIISVASGEIKTKNEINCYREIAIFKDGITL